MEDLHCTYEDYRKAAGFTGLGELVSTQPAVNDFFSLIEGGMHLPTVHTAVRAIIHLDNFVRGECVGQVTQNSLQHQP